MARARRALFFPYRHDDACLPSCLADHKIEAVSIPFKGKSIPAWCHLPPPYSGGKVLVVISIPGMDSFKESSIAFANDRWMARGVAVLAIDGPGQYESPLLGVYVSMQNWIVVHACINPLRPLDQQDDHDLRWIREHFLSDDRDYGRLIVHGHTPLQTGIPDQRHNRLNLDTGAVFGRPLTAAVVTNEITAPLRFLQAF